MATINTNYPFFGSIETRQGGRDENQDNAGFLDTPLGLLVVVCDGMGGGPGGRTASLIAVETIRDVLANVAEHTPRQDALKYAIEKANDAIYSKSMEASELQGMGTTVAAIIINEYSAIVAHVGDSRIYQLRKSTIVYRSADHSFVAGLVREKKLTEEEARNHPSANVITRALGIRPEVEIEFDEVSFLRGDRFVLCSDGIWGAMPEPELVKQLSQVMGIEELTATTADEIDQRGFRGGGGHDNLTLALLDASFNAKKAKFSFLSRYGYYIAALLLIPVICFSIVSLYSPRLTDEPSTSISLVVVENSPQKGFVDSPKGIAPKESIVDHNSPSESSDMIIPSESLSVQSTMYEFSYGTSVPSKHETTGGPDAPKVFQSKEATDVKNAERTKLIIRIMSNMEELKKKKPRSRKDYVQVYISPHITNLGELMDETKQEKMTELQKLTAINRTVKVRRKNRGGYVEVSWYDNNPSIDKLIQKLKDLDN